MEQHESKSRRNKENQSEVAKGRVERGQGGKQVGMKYTVYVHENTLTKLILLTLKFDNEF